MMVRIGNFFFRYRNGIFPVVLIFLFVPSLRLLPSDLLAAALGIAVASTGQILRAVTIGLEYIIRGGKNRQVYAENLVQGGMFAHCRNPLYVGNLLVILGLGLIANSLLFLLVGMPFFLFAYRAIIAAEEDFLGRKFGAGFTAYCRRVRRFIPNFSGFAQTWQGMEFNWRRLIVKEYGSTYVWMATTCALLIQKHWVRGQVLADPMMRNLFGLLALFTVTYLAARCLKKSRALVAD